MPFYSKFLKKYAYVATVVEVIEGMMKTLRISQAKHTRRNTS